MMRFVLLCALALAGCGEGASAEREYEIVSKNGTSADKCQAAAKVAAKYLAAHDQANYDQWVLKRDHQCFLARNNQ